MKKFCTRAAAALILAIPANRIYAQSIADITPVTASGTINFKSLADKELLNPPPFKKQKDNEEKENDQKGIPHNMPIPKDAKLFHIAGNFTTGLRGGTQMKLSSPAPDTTFDGILDNNAVIPPDINGAAGPAQLFETLNSEYKIFSKTGGVISSLSLDGFWSGLSSTGSPYSDPHIVYDANSGRWYSCIIAQLNNGHYGIFVAASLTNDPTGNWYEFSFDTGPSSILPDYPLLGYNKRWVVITTNDFQNFVFSRSRITVLNRIKLTDGTLTAASTFYDAGQFTISPAETMDAAENTEYMMSNYNGNSGGSGYLDISKITGPPSTPVYRSGAVVGINQPWSDVTMDAPQKNSSRLINTGGTKMRAIILRNGFIWATHTIYLPASGATHSASDFWQIDPVNDSVYQYGRINDPSGVLWVSYPSLAVTPGNDVLLGSTIVGSTIYASAAYLYRNASDNLNVFRFSYTYKTGLAPYFKDFGSGRNRWGDYSATSIDPANGSFWTLQEYAKKPANTWGSSWARVSAAAFPVVSKADNLLAVDDKSLTVSPNPAAGDFTINYSSAKSGSAAINVFNINGMLVYAKTVLVVQGINHINVNLAGAINGNYRVAVQNGNDIKQVELVISK